MSWNQLRDKKLLGVLVKQLVFLYFVFFKGRLGFEFLLGFNKTKIINFYLKTRAIMCTCNCCNEPNIIYGLSRHHTQPYLYK